MSGYGILWILVICLGLCLASKIHSNFNVRNNITKKITVLKNFIFLHKINLHRLILLQIWLIISRGINYRCLYSTQRCYLHNHIYYKRCLFASISYWIILNCFKQFGEGFTSALRGEGMWMLFGWFLCSPTSTR